MDDISDHVHDSAEFCRNVHTDPEWQRQAVEAIMVTGRYIQELNMHQGLYSAVVRSLQLYDRLQSHAGTAASTATPPTSTNTQVSLAEAQGYCEETVIVGRALQKDFEQRGVHLDAQGQSQALHMSQQIAVMGMHVAANTTDASQLGTVQIPDGPWVDELPTAWRSHMSNRLNALGRQEGSSVGASRKTGLWATPAAVRSVPLDQGSVNGIMQHVSDEQVRRQVWFASRESPEKNKQGVVGFCLLRRDFAQLLGFQSHAHLQAGLLSLAGTPEAVMSFLDQAHTASRHQAAEEFKMLRKLGGPKAIANPQPWDKAYLSAALKAKHAKKLQQKVPGLSAWLTLPDCLHALGTILQQLTAVTLQEVPMLPGESWAAGVRKMVAVHEDDGDLGTIYLDLFARPGKFGGAAHFTLRCGRQLSGGQYQTPVVALALSFDQLDGMLHHSSAATLVHEFGHALHSLLSRTRYQHLSGTRGAMDIVEIPSHFMENFVYDARTLQLFMPKGKGDKAAAKSAQALARQVKEDRHLLGALDLELQVCHSVMDQMFHGPEPPQSPAAANDELAKIWSKYSSFPGSGFNPHLRFAHLVNYGGSYYSYAYAMCLASSVWKKLFQADPLNRQAGNALRHGLLRFGGAKDPKDLVEGVLGHSALQHAGSGFMPHVAGLLHHYGIPETSKS
ncbi:hypothetical protein ABBQ38_007394 [Trebouxia sp. C0009 RCD-2024]